MTETQQQNKPYKKTLNLPKTAFSMKANLVQHEPASLKRWNEQGLYQQLREAEHPAGPFVFHDGPPYPNGSIHVGHLMNKILKDFVVRSQSMLGHDTPYVPGWDCHGLPIEHKVVQDLGERAGEMAPMQIRKRCRDYAEKYIKVQSEQMQRLLTLGNYEQPYLTMNPQYEGAQLEVLADIVGKGLVYRGLKPVHWSIDNQTALAEAELEYDDREDISVYVLFPVAEATALPAALQAALPDGAGAHLMIWTTTPWTLPANLAVAAAPRAAYGLYRYEAGRDRRTEATREEGVGKESGQVAERSNGRAGDSAAEIAPHANATRYAILADDLAEKVLEAGGATNVQRLAGCTGRDLAEAGATYRHPFISRTSPLVTADYVTLEDGTGLVHTAPGHGQEDYQTGLHYGLDIYCPVKGDGTFDETVPNWLQGKNVWDANGRIVQHLRDTGDLFHDHTFRHSYPHDWRGKSPVIFRATEQWFAAVDKPFRATPDEPGEKTLRDRATQVLESVRFYPHWGRSRMRGMLATRPDWCLSRQRAWGLPIPAFYHGNSGVLLTAASIRAVAEIVREEGSDAWFQREPAELLAGYDAGSDPDAPGWAPALQAEGWPAASLTRGGDVLDVWFDSGSSWHSVLRQRGMGYPADLYLEGSDQHRGWFQQSLLLALAVTGQSPFNAVLTHGFMVDKHGRKMSKSLGNTLEVEDLLKSYGADVCRWWCSSLAYADDVKVDEDFFKEAGEAYRKVRNTIRFMLSNLNDFEPARNAYSFTENDAASLDAWALSKLNELTQTVRAAFEQYEFRRAHQALFDFCNDTMSATYLAAVKDRLYCDKPEAPRRRRTQTALHTLADSLIRLLAPLLPHTADEAWSVLHGEPAQSVHLQQLPAVDSAACHPRWPEVMTARDGWLRVIENARQDRNIDNPLDCALTAAAAIDLSPFAACDMADLCGVSRFHADSDADVTQVADLSDDPRCERCWKRDETVARRNDEAGGLLCDRCAEAVAAS